VCSSLSFHSFFSKTTTRLALDGLVPLEEGEREVDLVRSRLPKGILVPDLQVRSVGRLIV